MMEQVPDAVSTFSRWLEANGAQLRASAIRPSKRRATGLGVCTVCDVLDGVLMVIPLHLTITPMTVLQDPDFGKAYAKLFEDGDVDDRLLMILFLMVERVRGSSSSWAPYLNVLPTSFGTTLWFTEKELQELQGTALYNATRIQQRNLGALFSEKVKPFAEEILASVGALKREISFEDFLWANCVFWARALNIPFPSSFVFPNRIPVNNETDLQGGCNDSIKRSELVGETRLDTVWVEGLVPGIDFCNHDPTASAKWEVDGPTGSITGVPNSMYLTTDKLISANDEILISYGNKGNEELFFLYGFVLENNLDDFYMIYYPKEALESDPLGQVKVQLLQEQNLTLRWVLPCNLLQNGFYSLETCKLLGTVPAGNQSLPSSFSWSGVRKPPSFLNKCVFTEETVAALRVVAMRENEVQDVITMLEELQEAPTGEDMRAAVWEVCGNHSALQLLTDLLSARLSELEEGTGTAATDEKLLTSVEEDPCTNSSRPNNLKSCLVYRKGQKHLAKQFLKEAERLLELTISEECNGRAVITQTKANLHEPCNSRHLETP